MLLLTSESCVQSVLVTWKLYVTHREHPDYIGTMKCLLAVNLVAHLPSVSQVEVHIGFYLIGMVRVWEHVDFRFIMQGLLTSPATHTILKRVLTQDSAPPIYWLCFSLLIVHYVVLCAPCIGILILVPLMCLCLPCLIKIANYMNAKNKERLNSWIKALPVHKFDPDEHEGDTTCSICLSEYEQDDEIRRMPTCDHAFHAACIDEWLLLNASCPVCRQPLRQVGTRLSQ